MFRIKRAPAEPRVELLTAVYSAVANRRTAFDTMMWQVPIISFTAQAFLFSVALTNGNTQVARTVACGLIILITAMSIHLMARHRQAEVADSKELAAMEKQFGIRVQHGLKWRVRRNDIPLKSRWVDFRVPGRAFDVWVVGLLLTMLVAVGLIFATWLSPDMLNVPAVQSR